jgi:phage tail sheath gpL-like
VSASAKTHTPAVKGATTEATVLRAAAARAAVARVVAVGIGVIPTQDATAQETAATAATVMAMTAAMDGVIGATVTTDTVETTAVEEDDETVEALVVTGEETSARSRPRQSQSSASLHQILRPSPTFRTARAV